MAAKTMSGLVDLVVKDATDKAVDLEHLAQTAEAAERYDDMVEIMRRLVEICTEEKKPLSADQRNLLSVAYKNVVGAKRSSWRMLHEPENVPDTDATLLADYKKIVEGELKSVCTQILKLLETLQTQNKTRMADGKGSEGDKKANGECQVFYLKMSGDYYRYLTEAFMDNKEYKDKCNEYYEQAMGVAQEQLEATHPTRLGLALNYSVCYYEILKQPEKACELAKQAFDEAIEKLDSLNDVSYKDSTLIMQLLRDNLTIWNQHTETDPAAKEEN